MIGVEARWEIFAGGVTNARIKHSNAGYANGTHSIFEMLFLLVILGATEK